MDDPGRDKALVGARPDPVSLAQADVRKGGRFRIVFGGPQGKDHEVQGVYKEVVPNRKPAFTWTWPNSTPEQRIASMMDPQKMPFDGKRMFYGGFKVLVAL